MKSVDWAHEPAVILQLQARRSPKTFSSDPANKVLNVNRQSKGGVDTLSFSVTGPSSSAHLRYMRIKRTLYILTIEFPNAYREIVATTKDKFFGSFKLKTKS